MKTVITNGTSHYIDKGADPEDIINDIYINILLDMYDTERAESFNKSKKHLSVNDSEMMVKIKNLLSKKGKKPGYSAPLLVTSDNDGSSDQSNLFRVASEKVAKDLKMNFLTVDEITDKKIDKNDYLFVDLDVDSNYFYDDPSISTLPSKTNKNNSLDIMLKAMSSAGGSALIFNNLLNTNNKSLFNIMISVMESKKINGRHINAYIGLSHFHAVNKTLLGIELPQMPLAFKNRIKILHSESHKNKEKYLSLSQTSLSSKIKSSRLTSVDDKQTNKKDLK